MEDGFRGWGKYFYEWPSQKTAKLNYGRAGIEESLALQTED